MRAINAIRMGGMEVLPLVEGGKGVSISNGFSSGNWAATGGVGTFSAVNADSFDAQGQPHPAALSRPHAAGAARGTGRLRHPAAR